MLTAHPSTYEIVGLIELYGRKLYSVIGHYVLPVMNEQC